MRVLYAHDCLAFKLCWGGFSEEMFRHYALETVVMIHAIVAFVVVVGTLYLAYSLLNALQCVNLSA